MESLGSKVKSRREGSKQKKGGEGRDCFKSRQSRRHLASGRVEVNAITQTYSFGAHRRGELKEENAMGGRKRGGSATVEGKSEVEKEKWSGRETRLDLWPILKVSDGY